MQAHHPILSYLVLCHVVPPQKPDKFVVKADIPGVDKADVTLTVDGDVLNIGVQAREEKQACACKPPSF